MSVLDDAYAALSDAEVAQSLRVSPHPTRLMRALRDLIADHEALIAEMHRRELHHFETEKLLTESGIEVS